ncbi:hypothetical protein HYT54_05150 [Candidatus Woesearchaeota archaeon]|nr:hypothetical protein [Candidatus Woesearchaeota archaeon]
MESLEQAIGAVERLANHLVISDMGLHRASTLKKTLHDAAMQGLTKEYSSSEWYTVRYLAGRKLRIYYNVLDNEVSGWIEELAAKLDGREDAPLSGRGPAEVPAEDALKARHDLAGIYQVHPSRKARLRISGLLHHDKFKFLGDELIRGELIGPEELGQIFDSSKASGKARYLAGRKLGYNLFDSLSNAYPIAIQRVAFSAGIVTGGLLGIYLIYRMGE